MQSSKRRRPVLTAVLITASLSLSSCSAVRAVTDSRRESEAGSPAGTAGATLSQGRIAPAEGLAAGILTAPLTGASARELVQAMYDYVISARVANDGDNLLSLLTGSQLATDTARQRHLACCYRGTPPKLVVVDDVAVLLGPGKRPGHLVGFIQARLAQDASQVFEDELVLVRQPDDTWRIALIVQALPRTGVRTSARGGAPQISTETALEILTEFGSDLESWHESGRPTDTRIWMGRADEFGQDKVDARRFMEERGYATEEFSFGVPDPSEVWIARSPEGADVICGVIPQEKTTLPTRGRPLRQDPARANWGFLFEPGSYLSFVEQAPYGTCVQTRDGGRTVEVLSQDWYSISGEGVRAD